jgi:hypothetical protein
MQSVAVQDIPFIQARAAELAKGYTVDSDIVAAAMIDSGGAIRGGNDRQYRGMDEPIVHHINHDNALKEFTFFNEVSAPFISNISNGQIPPQSVFGVENVGLELVVGCDRLGTVGTAAASFSASSTAGAAGNEAKRIAFATGIFELMRGTEVLYRVFGLDNLPFGGGLDASVSIAATAGAGVHTTNGAPFAGNKRAMGRGRTLLAGGEKISARIILPAVCNLGSSVNGFWRLALFGRNYRTA